MKRVFLSFFAALGFLVSSLEAAPLRIQQMFDHRDQKLMIMEDRSIWLLQRYDSSLFYPGSIVNLDNDNSQLGNTYHFVYCYENWNLDVKCFYYPAILLSYASEEEDAYIGKMQLYQVASSFSLSENESVIRLENGKILFIPSYQNTFTVGEELSIYHENENLAYLIKTVMIGDVKRDFLISLRRLAKNIYIN